MKEHNAANQPWESLGGSARSGGGADSPGRFDGGPGGAQSAVASAARPSAAGRRGPASWLGPRWIVPVRSLVVVLAMVAAALGVLWIESAGVQNASAQLAIETGGKVAVPPLEASAGTQPSGHGSPDPPEMSSLAAPTPPANGALPSSATVTQGVLVVHVAGAVKNPGVYRVGPGSRVFDAVNAAGGALPAAELAALNLAAPLADGLQVFVPTKEEAAKMVPHPGAVLAPDSVPGSAANSHPGNGLLNLNTASAAELDALPGVGPVLAERIVTWRTDHGPFASVDALDAVSGIGAKMMASLRDLVTVS